MAQKNRLSLRTPCSARVSPPVPAPLPCPSRDTARARSTGSQHRPASSEPCRFRAASHQSTSRRCIGHREQLQEPGRLFQPPPASSARASSSPRQFRVGVRLFLTIRRQRHPVSCCCTSLGCAIPAQGRQQSLVDRELSASKEGHPSRPPRSPDGVRPSL